MTWDLLVRRGRIVDGTGNPWFQADVAVADGRIAAIRPHLDGDARETLAADGLVVCPGFIDAHTHSDFAFFVDPAAQSKVRQGVTTEIIGNCGMSGAPYVGGSRERGLPSTYGFHPSWESFPEYLDALATLRKTVHLAPLVGHGTLRSAVVGLENRPPTPREQATMEAWLAEALAAGAVGMSTGLYFAPGNFATHEELVALTAVAGRAGAVMTSHIRDEGSRSVGFLPAVEELIRIGRDARAPVHISHIKSFGPDTWHTSEAVLTLIERARREGIDVTCDQYPYDTTGGGLAADTLPYDFLSGKSPAQVSEALRQPASRDAVRAVVAANVTKRGGPGVLTIATYPADPELEGRTLQEICDRWGVPPAEAVMEMLSQSAEAKWNCRSLCQEDVDRFLRYPATMVGSDGSSLSTEGPLSGGNPHPRNFGAFPRVLNEFVRQRGVLSLEEAVRKMTSLPAQRFGLTDRGLLTAGKAADLLLFDPEAVRDATFARPKQYPEGIPHVMVGGEWVIKHGAFTGSLPGVLARKP
ncbi:MAG: D-aminoacylase [Candidatus Methylomirabilota bacterium]